MLQQLLHIFIISFTCCSWGLIPLLLVKKEPAADLVWYRSWGGLIAFLFITGCMVLGLLSSWLYLVIPLRFTSLLLLTVIQLSITAILGAGKIKKLFSSLSLFRTRLTGIPLLFLITCLILFLVLSCLPTASTDTRIYHLQIVRWASEFPAVPGIANLFPRLGLGSNWFLLIGFFHIPGFEDGNFSYLNVTLVIWFFIWLFQHWKYHWQNWHSSPAHRSLCLFYFLLLVYFLYDWELLRGTAGSTDYDTIVTACIMLVICCWVECMMMDKGPGPSLLFVFIAFSALGFKLSGVFVLILLAYHLFRNRILSYWLFTSTLFLLTLVPVLIKNYIITGYPLYPLPWLAGNPDWKLPREMTSLLHNYIILSNRFYNRDFINSFAFRQQHTAWFAEWFSNILPQHKLIILLSIASLFLFFTKKKLPITYPRIRTFLLLLLLMEAAWFFTAPSPRFGYAALLCTALLPASLLFGYMVPVTWYRYGLLLTTIGTIIYLSAKMHTSSILIHPQPFVDQTATTIIINGTNYRRPETPASGYPCLLGHLPLPCTCQENPFLLRRGPSLRDGFRMQPGPDSTFIQQYKY